MLAKAHMTIGMAAAFTVMRPGSLAEALPVIAGGALGCLICDLDCENSRERTDSSHWRMVMAVVAAAALIEDHLLGAGMWHSLGRNGPYMWFAGLVIFVMTCVFASVSSHRGFSHSLLAMTLETGSLWLVFPQTALPFAVAFATHIILDVMNKRPVMLLWPAKKGVCFKWFYADRLANKVFAWAGTVWLVAAVVFSFI